MNIRLPREERASLQRSERRAAILGAAVRLAEAQGFHKITRDEVAAEAGVAAGSVNHEFGTVADMRDAVVLEAIDARNLTIVAQAIAAGHPAARDAPADLKSKAIKTLAA
jgi:AcrR family transcriptional regulator